MTVRRLRPQSAVVAVVVALIALAGCSGDDDSGSAPDSEPSGPQAAESDVPAWEFVTRPDLTPPKIDVTTEGEAGERALAGGDPVFIAPKDEKAPMNGPLIVDADGDAIWAHPLGDRWSYDLRVQRYDGRPVLTWWRGDTHPEGYGEGEFVIMDDSYRQIATVGSHASVPADFHDMTLTPRGTALLTSFPTVRHDLSEVGGPRDGYLLDCVVQEVDVRTGKTLFEWSALDHIPLSATKVDVSSDEDETGTKDGPLDPYHVNSVTEDGADAVLISARNTHAVYRIEKATGRIDWILGGSDSDFEMIGDSEFAWQHDAERQPDGTITLYDNEAAPAVGDESRGMRLALDEKNDTARVVEEYRPPEDRLSESQGSMQILDNGHVFVGWGSEPFYSEYTADGDLLYDAEYSGGISYRAFRQPWVGKPVEPPKFVFEDHTAYVSWNGATEVAAWRFVAGDDAEHANEVKTVPRDGFETSSKMPDRPYIAAEALDHSGKVLATARPGSWP